MRYGSVCSGIEAATRAWHPLGWTPAFFSEIEAFPSAVLAHHYGSNMPGQPLAKNGIPNHGDFTTIGESAGPIDLLVGGTPCQSFSVAGKRLGLDDPRGNLALEYLALARRLRARWFVWENVPGVLSSVSDEEDGEGGIQPGLEGREPGDEWIEESDFATFLEFVRECGYGFAYRVLDAQFVRVDGFARAVPQRRRRVFVVGYLGDWRPAAAVLLEPEGMRGDPAPRRQAGQGVAGAVDAGIDGDSWPAAVAPTLGTAWADRQPGSSMQDWVSQKGGLFVPSAFGGGNRAGAIDVSTALTAHGHRIDFEVETFIAEIAATLPAGGNSTGGERQPGMGAETAATMLVAHAIQAGALRENPDSGPDGVGVQDVLAYTLEARPEVQAVAFQSWTSSTNSLNPDDVSPTLDKAKPEGMAVAFQERGRSDGRSLEWQENLAYSLNAPAGGGRRNEINVATSWAVRRLTPRECERLQGFPDDFTDVPWRGQETAPDGPRYKALGNSMAVNVMRWIGMRIDIMEGLIKAGKVVAE